MLFRSLRRLRPLVAKLSAGEDAERQTSLELAAARVFRLPTLAMEVFKYGGSSSEFLEIRGKPSCKYRQYYLVGGRQRGELMAERRRLFLKGILPIGGGLWA